MLKVAIIDDGICEELLDNNVKITHHQILNGNIVKTNVNSKE